MILTLKVIMLYLYNLDDSDMDTNSLLGIASTKANANALIEQWIDEVVCDDEDGFVDLEETETLYENEKVYKARNREGNEWIIDIVINDIPIDELPREKRQKTNQQ